MGLRLEGKQIVLRDWQSEDLLHFQNSYAEDTEWMEYDGPYYPRASMEEVQERIGFLEKIIDTGRLSDPRTKLVIADR